VSTKFFHTSVTRIANFAAQGFEVAPLPRDEWRNGQYVLGEVIDCSSALRHVELCNGRMAEVSVGDKVVGVFGRRAATLEAVGDWAAIGPDLCMHALTSAGLFGRVTSKSVYLPALMALRYRGHVLVDGRPVEMRACVAPVPPRSFDHPVILVIGTSMSAGKTTACRVLVRELKAAGLTVIAAKLTGAARYRDALMMSDAGADQVFDFVDAGLPCTVCPPEEFRTALRALLSRMAALKADVVVVEAGASPLEPYNGDVAVAEIARNVRLTIVCASDPYAVVGVMQAFGRTPDLVCGGAANTDAAIHLVRKLTGIEALNLQEPAHLPKLRAMLGSGLGLAK